MNSTSSEIWPTVSWARNFCPHSTRGKLKLTKLREPGVWNQKVSLFVYSEISNHVQLWYWWDKHIFSLGTVSRGSYHHKFVCWILKFELEAVVGSSTTGIGLPVVLESVSQGTFSPYLSLDGQCWFLTFGLHAPGCCLSSVHTIGHSSGHYIIHYVSTSY